MFSLNLPVKLSYRRRQVLDQILDSGEADRILAEREAEVLAERKALIATIAAVPAKFVKLKAEAEKRSAAAYARFAAAEAETRAAHEEVRAATAQAMVASRDDGEIQRLQQELRTTADPRLADVRRELRNLQGHVKMMVRFVPYRGEVENSEKPGYFFKGTLDAGNFPECEAARLLLGEWINRAEVMMLAEQGASRSEVTKMLRQIIADISKPLKAIGVQMFKLNDELEIQAPPVEFNPPRSDAASQRFSMVMSGSGAD
jgi:hypothetical protein